MNNWTYEKAGVSVEAGYEAVRRMKPFAEKTYIPGVLAGLGGFGGCFALPKGYDEPVLVSGTDSVGTKLKVAYLTGVHNTVGIDCVAMCVNDIICQGAKPLFFLDYIGTGKIEPAQIAAVVEGVSEGCLQAGCALIGGETAELSGIYQEGEYDLAGFAVGIVEKSKLITGAEVSPGDVLIGVASSGLHSNGFSLARRLAFEQGRTHETFIPELNRTLGGELLLPTKIYAKLMNGLTERFPIKGAANITGGGWIENIPRIFGGNKNVKAVLDASAAPVPPVFGLLQSWGNVKDRDMYNTFNMGVGLVLAAEKELAEELVNAIGAFGENAYIIGYAESRSPGEADIQINGI
ncbi:MAG: phosphoribosylformylglycinamidine cyclo-ligase [Clostridiales bacterium]|jgi:phosphoribosylformylglycinamidine cyclo-ligase|nr:phosphoribosylformylglycinamidine cyclo-ligase [Clostridiales bacterium]